VLETVDQLRQVEQRLKKNRPPLRHRDYIKTPRASGYRAVHVVVAYPDWHQHERAIEVQLRTTVMHEWATTVERLSGRLRDDLKSDRGPRPLLTLMSTISEAMALEEAGHDVPPDLKLRIAELRAAAVPYIGG
jgi:ppGpp synthetase/RelA/SpoT-type nucleotidyltranferase